MSELKVTSLEELTEYSKGQIVELPPFADGQPFVARLRRPSLLTLAKNGSIPNELLISANELFTNAGLKPQNKQMLSNTFSVFDAICNASFTEPTMDQLKEAGIQLTDEQYIFVFNYAQRGVKALKSFRQNAEHSDSAADVEVVSQASK